MSLITAGAQQAATQPRTDVFKKQARKFINGFKSSMRDLVRFSPPSPRFPPEPPVLPRGRVGLRLAAARVSAPVEALMELLSVLPQSTTSAPAGRTRATPPPSAPTPSEDTCAPASPDTWATAPSVEVSPAKASRDPSPPPFHPVPAPPSFIPASC